MREYADNFGRPAGLQGPVPARQTGETKAYHKGKTGVLVGYAVSLVARERIAQLLAGPLQQQLTVYTILPIRCFSPDGQRLRAAMRDAQHRSGATIRCWGWHWMTAYLARVELDGGTIFSRWRRRPCRKNPGWQRLSATGQFKRLPRRKRN